jgi:hypothetical protein
MTAHSGEAGADRDQRPRQLLERYTSLVGTMLLDTAEHVVEFDVPPNERRFWQDAERVCVALSPEALDEVPEAEVLAAGSPLFERLVEAIRERGAREAHGIVPPGTDPSAEAVAFPVPLDRAASEALGVELSLLPVGRLTVRVSIKAGARIEERLIESVPVDLSTGEPLSPELVAAFARASPSSSSEAVAGARQVAGRPVGELLQLMFDEIGEQLAPELHQIRMEAEQALRADLARLERYYSTLLAEIAAGNGEEPDSAARARLQFEAEHQRRKTEEEERSRLRVTLHPLQVSEYRVLAQRAAWRLTSPAGHTASVQATRLLSGNTDWRLPCATCGAPPEAVRVCRGGHAGCPACSAWCSICGEGCCRTHGLITCPIEGHAVCGEHARRCGSCDAAHCSAHSSHCRLGDHEVCPACASQCAHCGVPLCKAHATRTGDEAPRGSRLLCASCVVHCEGGSSEPVGLDEAVQCASCDKHICEVHQAVCAVDGRAHCSRHLRRSDHSGRLACEEHRAECEDDPGAILASDEVAPCAACGRITCDKHGGRCDADAAPHCNAHLATIADKPQARACEAHRAMCHVDRVFYSLAGTQVCQVCGKRACVTHRAACSYCARHVCVADHEMKRCLTCRSLAETSDPPDDLLHAAIAANGGQPVAARGWRTARDASDTVVELNLGWTRRLVFVVAHGDTKPSRVIQHSFFGASRRR